MIVAVMGLPGSGKSFFAEKLAEVLKAVYLSSDRLRKTQFADYSASGKEQVYESMLKEMQNASEAGMSVVLDATFYKRDLRRQFTDAAKLLGEELQFIEVWAEEKLLKERLKQKREFSDADYDVYLKVKKEFEPVKRPHLKLKSANTNLEEMLHRALLYLNG